jgi:hypothetical protein
MSRATALLKPGLLRVAIAAVVWAPEARISCDRLETNVEAAVLQAGQAFELGKATSGSVSGGLRGTLVGVIFFNPFLVDVLSEPRETPIRADVAQKGTSALPATAVVQSRRPVLVRAF